MASTTRLSRRPISPSWEGDLDLLIPRPEGDLTPTVSTPPPGEDAFHTLQTQLPQDTIDVLGFRPHPNKEYMPGARTWMDFKALHLPPTVLPIFRKGTKTLVRKFEDSTYWIYNNATPYVDLTGVIRRLSGEGGRMLAAGTRTLVFFQPSGLFAKLIKTRWDGQWGLRVICTCLVPRRFEESEWICFGGAFLGVFARPLNGATRIITLVYFDHIDRKEDGAKYYREFDTARRGGDLKFFPFISFSYFGAVMLEGKSMDIYYYCRTNAPALRKIRNLEVESFERGVATCCSEDHLFVVDCENFLITRVDLKGAKTKSKVTQVARARYWNPGKVFPFKVNTTFIMVIDDGKGGTHIRTWNEDGKGKKWVVAEKLRPVETTYETGGIILADRFRRIGFVDLTRLAKGEPEPDFAPAGEI